jgi:hypothetical protein
MLTLTLGTLMDCGAVGATHLHLHIHVQATDPSWGPTIEVGTAHASGKLTVPPEGAFFGGDIELPVETSGAAGLAEVWMREIARSAGIDWWEPPRGS